MDSPRALEERLRRHPEDAESWLVYADWLSEQGDARGELIGLEHRRMTSETTAFLEQHRDEWSIAEAPPQAELTWRSGFVVSAAFLCSDETIDRLPALLAHPSARLLGELRLRFPSHDEEDDEAMFEDGYEPPPVDASLLQRVLATDLSRIRSLSFDYTVLGDAGAEALVRAPQVTALISLDLRYAALGDPAAELLAEWPGMHEVATLKLQRNRIGARGARALASSQQLERLTSLDLRLNPIGAEGARALATSPHLARLTALHLYGDDVGPEGAAALARSPTLPANLRRYWAAVSSTHV
jgi:uncharacterized protein (TIGR02996 family)